MYECFQLRRLRPRLIFLRQADMMQSPSDVFKFMYKNKIGRDLALFYVAWAWATEMAGAFARADKIYTTGLERSFLMGLASLARS